MSECKRQWKGTPGPWRAEGDLRTGFVIKDPSGHTSDASDVCYVNEEKENWGDEFDGDLEVNARAIAAAPTMWELLAKRLTHLRHRFDCANLLADDVEEMFAIEKLLNEIDGVAE